MNKLAFEQGFRDQCTRRGFSLQDTLELRKIAEQVPAGFDLRTPTRNNPIKNPGVFRRGYVGSRINSMKAHPYITAGGTAAGLAGLSALGYALWPDGTPAQSQEEVAQIQALQQQQAALEAQRQADEQAMNQIYGGAGGALAGGAGGYMLGRQFDHPYLGAALGATAGGIAGSYLV